MWGLYSLLWGTVWYKDNICTSTDFFSFLKPSLPLHLTHQWIRAVSLVPAATMFWKFDLHTTSHIDQLLDREDVTLRELMEEDDVLQECKAQNRRLLLFLSQDHCMQELVNLITTEPPADLEEKSRFKWVFSVTDRKDDDVRGLLNIFRMNYTIYNLILYRHYKYNWP